METLRGTLSDLVNELQKLMLEQQSPDDQRRLNSMIKILMLLWEEVIRKQLDATSAEYAAALRALQYAVREAEAARVGSRTPMDAVRKAADAAKAVDRVVGFGLSLLM